MYVICSELVYSTFYINKLSHFILWNNFGPLMHNISLLHSYRWIQEQNSHLPHFMYTYLYVYLIVNSWNGKYWRGLAAFWPSLFGANTQCMGYLNLKVSARRQTVNLPGHYILLPAFPIKRVSQRLKRVIYFIAFAKSSFIFIIYTYKSRFIYMLALLRTKFKSNDKNYGCFFFCFFFIFLKKIILIE